MKDKLKIGIVGCGAIGTSMARAIVSDFAQQTKLAAVYDVDSSKARELAARVKAKRVICACLESVIKKSDLVIEAAEAKSSFRITKKALEKGRDVIVLSVGGVVEHVAQLRTLARKKHARVYVPSGAACGVDGLKGSSQGKIKRVTLTTYKSPKSLSGVEYVEKKGIKLNKLTKDTVLFSGSARRAVKLFPKNINVAATLSIAGIGLDKTKVRIIASPAVTRNIHQVQVESSAGKIVTRVENVLHPENPKTSFLAVLAAIVTLRQVLDPVKIGT